MSDLAFLQNAVVQLRAARNDLARDNANYESNLVAQIARVTAKLAAMDAEFKRDYPNSPGCNDHKYAMQGNLKRQLEKQLREHRGLA